MHLQQTKRASIQSGGPQYYFHDLDDAVKTYLRAKGAVAVALVTPYGATKSNYVALSKDHKLDSKGKITAGSVGHDRIQQGQSTESIGEAISGMPCQTATLNELTLKLTSSTTVFTFFPSNASMLIPRKSKT